MEIWSLISKPLLLAVWIDFLEPNHLFSVWMGPICYFITVEVRPVLCTVPFKQIDTLLTNKRQPMINCRCFLKKLCTNITLTFFLPIFLVCTCKILILILCAFVMYFMNKNETTIILHTFSDIFTHSPLHPALRRLPAVLTLFRVINFNLPLISTSNSRWGHSLAA